MFVPIELLDYPSSPLLVSLLHQQQHLFEGSTLLSADTPSLVGLAASAPYFHDGSAPTIDDVVHERGAVRGMADTSSLTAAEAADLEAFLATR